MQRTARSTGYRIIGILTLTLALTACSLPRNAALKSEILGSADKDETSDYAVYPVTRELVSRVNSWPMTGKGPRGGWISAGGGSSGATIAAGDRVSLTIWDNEETSLLTSPGQKSVSMNNVVVDPSGRVFVPYVDGVKIAGLSTDSARRKIQDSLAPIVPSAQVQLEVMAGRENSVDVVAGVSSPGPLPMVDGSLTVLSAISQSGGVRESLGNPVVRLVRGGKVHVTTLARLYDDPGLDTALRGGDKIIVEDDPRSFLALGETGSQRMIKYPQDKLTALEALALIGGVDASRADPRGVMVLREYPDSAVSDGRKGPEETRVIFVMDLTSADGLFSAGRFQINPDDVVYASESPLIGVGTITGLIGSLLGTANRAASVSE